MAKKYCNIDDVKEIAPIVYQDLGFDNESDYDKFVGRIIDRASRQVDRYCSRPDDFFSGGSTVTEYFDGNATESDSNYPETDRTNLRDMYRRTYHVSHTPILTITSVHKNDAAIGETDVWTAITKYRVNTTTGRFVFSSSVAPDEGVENVRFIYVAGYAAVPDTVKQACEELVANGIKTTVQQFLNSKVRFARPTPVAFTTPEVFTDSVKEKLEPYKARRM